MLHKACLLAVVLALYALAGPAGLISVKTVPHPEAAQQLCSVSSGPEEYAEPEINLLETLGLASDSGQDEFRHLPGKLPAPESFRLFPRPNCECVFSGQGHASRPHFFAQLLGTVFLLI